MLVLHAWWGLTAFIERLCDRLAIHGYVAFAPDMHQGLLATTIDAAKHIMAERDESVCNDIAAAALEFFRHHPAVTGAKVGVIGFSMGTDVALELNRRVPEAFSAIVLFYGGSWYDLSKFPLPIMGHFAGNDEYEPVNQVQALHGDNVTIHVYPDARHWFFEDDRPEFNARDAALAWDRTLAFLSGSLSVGRVAG